jgi:hypothetical protein
MKNTYHAHTNLSTIELHKLEKKFANRDVDAGKKLRFLLKIPKWRLTGTQAACLIYIINRYNFHRGYAEVSLDEFAEATGRNRSGCRDALVAMLERGIVDKDSRRGRANCYFLHDLEGAPAPSDFEVGDQGHPPGVGDPRPRSPTHVGDSNHLPVGDPNHPPADDAAHLALVSREGARVKTPDGRSGVARKYIPSKKLVLVRVDDYNLGFQPNELTLEH